MAKNFRFLALPASTLDTYTGMSDAELQDHAAYWFVADADPCYPCRVSLDDAKVGERVLAINYTHHDVNSPYKSSGPIFIRETAVQAQPEPGEIPKLLRHRLLSLRGYSDAALMIEAAAVEGQKLEEQLTSLFANEATEYIHIHNARQGCFNCTVVRA